jgi:drug/metabolite transporter (DMT)-like permease
MFGRRVSGRIWLCIATAIAGMYLLCIKEALTLNLGDLFVLVCAVFSAAQILVIDRYAPLVNAVKLASLQFFVCSGLSAIAAAILEKPDLNAVFQGWLPLLYTGVFSSSVAYSMQIAGQKYVAPVLAALLLSLEAVFGALAGWLILGELLTPSERIGCFLIFGAILAAQLPGRMGLPGAERKP